MQSCPDRSSVCSEDYSALWCIFISNGVSDTLSHYLGIRIVQVSLPVSWGRADVGVCGS